MCSEALLEMTKHIFLLHNQTEKHIDNARIVLYY